MISSKVNNERCVPTMKHPERSFILSNDGKKDQLNEECVMKVMNELACRSIALKWIQYILNRHVPIMICTHAMS